jgi:hypothetical protein
MSPSKQKMVTAMFRSHDEGQEAYQLLLDRGYASSEINVLMSDASRSRYYWTEEKARVRPTTDAAEGVGLGGAIGTAVGAATAAVLAIGTSVVVPGLGLAIAGPLAAAFAGGGAGAVAGGIIGGLIGMGNREPNAQAYLEVLREGGLVLGVVPHDAREVEAIQRIFEDLHGEAICYC